MRYVITMTHGPKIATNFENGRAPVSPEGNMPKALQPFLGIIGIPASPNYPQDFSGVPKHLNLNPDHIVSVTDMDCCC